MTSKQEFVVQHLSQSGISDAALVTLAFPPPCTAWHWRTPPCSSKRQRRIFSIVVYSIRQHSACSGSYLLIHSLQSLHLSRARSTAMRKKARGLMGGDSASACMQQHCALVLALGESCSVLGVIMTLSCEFTAGWIAHNHNRIRRLHTQTTSMAHETRQQ